MDGLDENMDLQALNTSDNDLGASVSGRPTPSNRERSSESSREGSENLEEEDEDGNDSEVARRVTELTRELRRVRAEAQNTETNLRQQIRTKNRRIALLQRNPQNIFRRTEETWPQALDLWLRNELGTLQELFPDLDTYDKIYKQACLEGNSNPSKVHPFLTLTMGQDWIVLSDDEASTRSSPEIEERGGEERGQAMSVQPVRHRWADRLGVAIQARILKFALVFADEVHALSRIPCTELPGEEYRRNNAGRIRFFHRFHTSRTPTSVEGATKPNDLLAPLLVCKSWLMIGCHLFYGLNTFAFSSLGELGRFMAGSGGRIQRITSVELFWTGSQCLTYAKNRRGRFISRRTQPLLWLPQCLRLRDITIWFQEIKGMRRNHENRGTAVYLAKRTFAQPNHRLCRSLRTVQGIDCLYSLRGLRTVRIFDYDQFLYVANREAPIRDTSFLQDVLNSVRQKKEPVDATKAKLRNLQPLIRGYEPDNEVWRCLRKLLSEGRPGRDDDEGSDGRRPESIIDRNSAANTGSDDDNDSESETGSGSDDGGSSSSSDDDAGSDDPDQGAAQRVRDHDRVGSDAPISFDFDDRAVDFHGLDSPSRSLGSDAGSQADSDGRRDERRRARLPRSSTHSRTPSRPESVVDLTESGSSDSPVSSGNAGAYGNGGSGDGSRESPLFVENFDINQHHSGAQNANNSPAGSSDSAQGSDGSGSSDGSSLFCSPTPYQGIVNLENGGRGTQSAESIDLTGDDDDDRAMARNMKRSTSIDEGSVKSETPKRRCLSLTMEEAVRINLFWEIED